MVQRSLRVHTFSSPACVHAIESSDDGSHRSAMEPNGKEESRKKIIKKVTKLLLPLKHRWHVSQVFRSLSRGAKSEAASSNKDGTGDDVSDVETFVSATSSELRSFFTDADDSEPPSFRLSPPPIFPTGSIGHPPPASPVKIVQKLPFGYVIGRQLSAPAPASSLTLARNIKKVMPVMAALNLRSRSQMVKKKVVRALEGTFRQGRPGGAREGYGCGDDDEDVFWKKDVRGLRCRRLEDNDDRY